MQPWLGKNKSALAIVRVSTKGQEKNYSPETQEHDISEYCERQGLELEAILRIAESARDSDNRTKYTHAINRALTENIRHLLFYMYDRETRNLTDNEKNEKLVKADLICIHYVRENKVLYQGSPDSEFFIRDVQAAANKQFIRNLSAKVTDAMRQKAESGWYPSNHVPLGYIVKHAMDPSGRIMKRGSTVVRDPNETKVKQAIREFELRAQGYSFEEIRKAVIAERLIGAEKISQYTKGAIEKRIANPFYEGRFVWQGTIYPGKHEIIIPAHLIAQAREPRKRGLKVVRPDSEFGIFARWITCGECGCSVVYDPKRKVNQTTGAVTMFHYYHCSNGKRSHLSLSGMNVPESSLWEQFDQAIGAITLTPSLASEIADALNATHKQVVGSLVHQIDSCKANLKALEEREDRAYDDFIRGVLDQETYRRQVQRIRAERHRLQGEMQAAQAQIQGNYRETVYSILELCKDAKSLYLSRSRLERADFLKKILSNPRLTGPTLEYNLRKPFSTLGLMNITGEWRAHLDDFRTECVALHEEGTLWKRTH